MTAYVGICLLEWGTWRRLAKMRRSDAAAFLSTALATMLWNAVAAILIGCAVAALPYLFRRRSQGDPQVQPQTA